MNTICFGEILWDVLPHEKVPGGAPMNVCYHLNQLGQTAALISKIGSDADGQDLLAFLNRHQVDTSLVQVDGDHPTGTVIATPQGQEMTYDIVAPVAWDFIDHSEALIDAVSRADYFVCGSLAARQAHSRESLYTLLEAARTKIVDINLRPPHYERSTLESLIQQADILKLNHHELKLIAGWLGSAADVEQQVRLLSRTFDIPTIIVTKGAAGASLLTAEHFLDHEGYRVEVVDTIGSGDAFLAGYLSIHMQRHPPARALDFACKMGAFVASKKGACPPYDAAAVAYLNA